MPAVVIQLTEAAGQPLARVGGKAQALGRLLRARAPVPAGFIVPPATNLEATRDQILAAHTALGVEFVAVRSSATGEDGDAKSWAGQFTSFLYVSRADLIARIAACRRSGLAGRVKAYDAAGRDMPVAVVVQAMVPADAAGVLFTANPVTGDRSQVMIEAVYGLGELLVSGAATPDNYLTDKSTGRMLEEHIAQKTVMLVGTAAGTREQAVPTHRQNRPALSPAQRAELARLSVRLETDFRQPLDIEWAYAAGTLYILQARPITTLKGGSS